ncbi:murein transglycosylase A [Undibacterium sp. Jales W-56]|uniref:murein transglycosylase A n=1 Tax=Undibacterium sp. Jales W-56 TaxID=2897325 RepID=UPI0021D2169B|nr:murein transglycosylase A [Undibacterium sp. Jales W-56]MCU6435161.1 murein transglycosylase A [Undibacterium sp. Jales W-56]
MLKFSAILPLTAAAVLLAACTSTPMDKAPATVPPVTRTPVPAPGVPVTIKNADLFKPVSFSALPGWQQDDLTEAWPAFMASCSALRAKPDWKEPCSIAKELDAKDNAALRLFFESFFVPHQVNNPDGSGEGLVTGYYEPLLHGSRKRGGVFQTPLYRTPADLLTIDLSSVYPELKNLRLRGRVVGNKVVPYASRAEILPAVAGKELVWVDDAIEAFFLQIQGSGRVALADSNETIRLAYADQNGHPYKSIGRYLVDKGELKLEQASAQGIKEWLVKNPNRQEELLNVNPSVVFFKEEKILDPGIGPKGALGVPLTGQRSIAIDPQFLPLGVPVFLSTTQPNSARILQKLVLAQDTGGAIRGAVRADYFWGFGSEAGEQAGRMKQRGALWLLLPKSIN